MKLFHVTLDTLNSLVAINGSFENRVRIAPLKDFKNHIELELLIVYNEELVLRSNFIFV